MEEASWLPLPDPALHSFCLALVGREGCCVQAGVSLPVRTVFET